MLDVIDEYLSVSSGGSEAGTTDSEHVVIFGGVKGHTVASDGGGVGPGVGAHAHAKAADGLLIGLQEHYEVLNASGLLDAWLSPALDLCWGGGFYQAIGVTDTDWVVLVVVREVIAVYGDQSATMH